MDRIELARTLHEMGRGALSDAVTRAVNRGDLSVVPLPVRSATHETVRRSGRRRRTVDAVVETAGVNAWLLDEDTAVALARGGILLRDPVDRVFSSPTVDELAALRDEAALGGYLADAEELVATVLGTPPIASS